ncbi:hypothetical protein, partial [Lactobacillus jensenii]|uniref:hypothetical protein n=1 Tax=Lactobacillus jensenii TaxID=109790 RepID=UPI001F088B97
MLFLIAVNTEIPALLEKNEFFEFFCNKVLTKAPFLGNIIFVLWRWTSERGIWPVGQVVKTPPFHGG